MKFLILLLFSISLISCSKNKSKVFEDPDQLSDPNQNTTFSDSEGAFNKELEQFFVDSSQTLDKDSKPKFSNSHLLKMYDKYKNLDLESIMNLSELTPDQVREKVLKPLQPFLINTHWFFIPEIRGQQRFVSIVQEINRAQIISLNETPLSNEGKLLAEEYANFMLEECLPSKNNFEVKDCHVYEQYFTVDTKIANFLNIYAKKNTDILSKKLLEISNCENDQACIDQSYNQCFSNQQCKGSLVDYYFILSKVLDVRDLKIPENFRNNSIQFISLYLNYAKTLNLNTESTQRQISNFLRVMGPEQIKNDPDLRALIESKDTFKCSTQKASTGIFQGLNCFEYLLAAAPLMVESCQNSVSRKNCKLSKNLLSAIHEKKTSSIEKSKLSSVDHFTLKFDDYIDSFIENNELEVLESFGLNRTIDTNNLWFYYIDSVYQRDLLPSEVASLEAEIKKNVPILTKRDFEDFKEILMYYMQLEVLRMNSRSNEFMFDFYADVAKSGVADQNLINVTLDKAKNLESNWNEVKIERFGALQQMASVIFDQFEDEVKGLKDSFLSIDNTINYLNVYPNMIMLTTYMALREFEFELRWWVFTFKIDYKRIIGQMFSTGLGNPWFEFGGGAPLKNYQILYSLIFAHKSGIFEKFSPIITNLDYVDSKELSKEKIQDSKIEFYKTLIFSYIQDDITNQDNFTNNVREDLDSETYDRLTLTCDNFNTNVGDEDGYLLDLEKVDGVLSLPIEALDKSLRIGSLDKTIFTPGYPLLAKLGQVSHALVDIYSDTSRSGLGRYLSAHHKEYRQKLDFIKNLADVYKSYLVSGIENNIEKKEEFEKELEEIKEIYLFIDEKKWKFDELIARSFDYEKRYGGCMYAISKIYRQRAAKLIDLEKERLDSIFSITKFLNNLLDKEIDINNTSIYLLDLSLLNEEDSKIAQALVNNLEFNKNTYKVEYPDDFPILNAANELIGITKNKLQKIVYPKGNGLLPIDVDSSFCLSNNNQSCGHDRITEDSGILKFKYSKYDFLIRTAEKLRLINPDLHIQAPVEFKNIADSASSHVDVFFTDNKEDFLEKTLGVFHEDSTLPKFSTWWSTVRGADYSTFTSSKFNDRQRYLVFLYNLSGYKAKSVDCYDALKNSVQPIKELSMFSECNEDVEYSLNDRYLIKDALAGYETIAITEKEKSLLSTMKFDNLYSYNFTKSIFRDKEDLTKEAFLFNNLLQNYHQLIINTNFEKGKTVESGGGFLGFRNQLTNFETQTRNLGSLLFGYSYDLICSYKENFRSWGSTVYGKYFRLQNSINKFGNEYYQNLQIDYNLISSYTVPVDEKGKYILYDRHDYVTIFRDKFFAFFNKTLRGYFGEVTIENGYDPNYNILDSDNKEIYMCKQDKINESDVLVDAYAEFLVGEGIRDEEEVR